MSKTLDHLMNMALPATADYFSAEQNAASDAAKSNVLRRAYETAIALDGLVDRATIEFGGTKANIVAAVDSECRFPGGAERPGCIRRIRAVANAYKHSTLDDASLPIASESDVLVFAAGFGVDGFGVGKFEGVETLMKDKSGQVWKFLGDVPSAVFGWAAFLRKKGVALPGSKYTICNVEIVI